MKTPVRPLLLFSLGCCLPWPSPAAGLPAASSVEPAARVVQLPAARMAPARAQMFGQLRAAAAMGDVQASRELATRLLDRFERTGDKADLHEAMQWIARDWDQEPFLRTDVANLVLSRHCARPVLKAHWLCSGGE